MSTPIKITTVNDIKSRKDSVSHTTSLPLVCLTAYTTNMAKILDPFCDLLLVGDSLGNVLYGYDSTRKVDLNIMIRHGEAVIRGRSSSCVIIDLPYGTYESSPEQALKNAREVMKKTGADGVKMEGGVKIEKTIAHLVANDIPVMGHIGLLPQSVVEANYSVKGKTPKAVAIMEADAKAVENAGAFSVVIEATLDHVANDITKMLSIPTVGIGASAACDGQILVIDDMLGMSEQVPKFVKKFGHLKQEIEKSVQQYRDEVQSRKFPSDEYLYHSKK